MFKNNGTDFDYQETIDIGVGIFSSFLSESEEYLYIGIANVTIQVFKEKNGRYEL